MNIALAVHGAPAHSSAPRTALDFATAAVDIGHTLIGVFFYHEGVLNSLPAKGQSDDTLQRGWIDFSHAHEVPLLVCVGAAESRGIKESSNEPDATGKPAPAFQLVGLGQLTELILNADRFVTFGA